MPPVLDSSGSGSTLEEDQAAFLVRILEAVEGSCQGQDLGVAVLEVEDGEPGVFRILAVAEVVAEAAVRVLRYRIGLGLTADGSVVSHLPHPACAGGSDEPLWQLCMSCCRKSVKIDRNRGLRCRSSRSWPCEVLKTLKGTPDEEVCTGYREFDVRVAWLPALTDSSA